MRLKILQCYLKQHDHTCLFIAYYLMSSKQYFKYVYNKFNNI